MKRAMIMAAALLSLACTGALAHKPSDAYLTIVRDGAALEGRWDVALRDVEVAIGLDADGDGAITWGEVRARQDAIDAYVLSRLAVRTGGNACALRATAHSIDTHTDGAYVVITLAGDCDEAAPTLAIDYRLLFDVDPTHRGLLNYVERGETRSAILSADAPAAIVGGDTGGVLAQIGQYVHEGVRHIWTGFDHMLFLLSLLLPAVLVRRAAHGSRHRRFASRSSTLRRWSPRSRSRIRSHCRSRHSASSRCLRGSSNRRSRCRSCSPR